VRLELSPTFYSWLTIFGNRVKIVAPTEAIEGMKAFIEAAASMYE
jgi:hypothetical protein